jgi:hypothetical protein
MEGCGARVSHVVTHIQNVHLPRYFTGYGNTSEPQLEDICMVLQDICKVMSMAGLHALLKEVIVKGWFPVRTLAEQYKLSEKDIELVNRFAYFIGFNIDNGALEYDVSPPSGVWMFSHWRTIAVLLSNVGLHRHRIKLDRDAWEHTQNEFIDGCFPPLNEDEESVEEPTPPNMEGVSEGL